MDEDFDISKVIVQEDFSYGPHDLQSLTVYTPVGASHNERGYFIIYIHGGAWRDPHITPSCILPSLTHLLGTPSLSPLVANNIRAIASLSYRLSPHPSFPQGPSTPASELRQAKHPDHLIDILGGISFLQAKYGFDSRYVLAGHSCGATLALQVLIRSKLLAKHVLELEAVRNFVEPEVVVGLAGIYDLRLLRDSHSHAAYHDFLVGAFGEDEKVWDEVSPTNEIPEWKAGRRLVLVSSSGDELVDEGQINVMGERTRLWNVETDVWRGVLDMTHDEIWKRGVGLGGVLGRVLREFFCEKD